MPVLLEQHRARRAEFDCHGGGQQHWAEDDDGQQGQAAVHQRLGECGGGVGGQRAFIQVDGRHAGNVAHRVVEQHHAAQVG